MVSRGEREGGRGEEARVIGSKGVSRSVCLCIKVFVECRMREKERQRGKEGEIERYKGI